MTASTRIRVSSLPTFPDCPRRWAAQHLRAEIQAAGYELRDGEPGIAGIIGTSLHFGAEVSLKEKLTSGALPPFSVAEEAALQTLHEEIRRSGVRFDKSLSRNQDIAERQLRRMTQSYHAYVAPRINPIAVEQRLEADVPWTRQPMILSGQPDVVACEANGVDLDVDDLKSGIVLGNFNAQAGGYAMLERTTGKKITGANVDFVPRKSLTAQQPPPTAQRLDVALCENMAKNTLLDIDRDLTIWREGDPEHKVLPGDPAAFRANPRTFLCKSYLCPAHSCGKRGFCQEWRKDETQ